MQTTKTKLKFFLKIRKISQKSLMPKWLFFIYNRFLLKGWVKFKLFSVLYDEDKFKRRRIKVARYPTKPWMRGREYSKFKKRYQSYLVSDSVRYSKKINKTLNCEAFLNLHTELKTNTKQLLTHSEMPGYLKTQLGV